MSNTEQHHERRVREVITDWAKANPHRLVHILWRAGAVLVVVAMAGWGAHEAWATAEKAHQEVTGKLNAVTLDVETIKQGTLERGERLRAVELRLEALDVTVGDLKNVERGLNKQVGDLRELMGELRAHRALLAPPAIEPAVKPARRPGG